MGDRSLLSCDCPRAPAEGRSVATAADSWAAARRRECEAAAWQVVGLGLQGEKCQGALERPALPELAELSEAQGPAHLFVITPISQESRLRPREGGWTAPHSWPRAGTWASAASHHAVPPVLQGSPHTRLPLACPTATPTSLQPQLQPLCASAPFTPRMEKPGPHLPGFRPHELLFGNSPLLLPALGTLCFSLCCWL